jgi:hypothetical protein
MSESETFQEEFTIADLLKESHLHVLSTQTIYNWLSQLGFRYSPSEKSCYVNLHEKEENIQYHLQFIK